MTWEKKLSFTELDKAIKDSNEARQILQQNQKVTVKQEPIGRIKISYTMLSSSIVLWDNAI